ncbi:hypothetical protein CDCA_CDCA06G1773 [Cyanidium caldarium]|uniref:mRNA export factor GLE1 n=1 Tax=Cyanidium caldarium TaxID=2771 RepID=A0AAV9IUI7_CYACA|nr:hypothetical protein CDCA_CDCA06G1773 [Cyanidium caldarium]
MQLATPSLVRQTQQGTGHTGGERARNVDVAAPAASVRAQYEQFVDQLVARLSEPLNIDSVSADAGSVFVVSADHAAGAVRYHALVADRLRWLQAQEDERRRQRQARLQQLREALRRQREQAEEAAEAARRRSRMAEAASRQLPAETTRSIAPSPPPSPVRPVRPPSPPAKTAPSPTLASRPEALEWRRALEFCDRLQEAARRFERDTAATAVRLQLKKRVNLAVNQIALSEESVIDKSQLLVQLLQQGGSDDLSLPSAAWVHLRIAERIVREGEGQVVLSTESAFALGSVLVALCAACPSLREMVMAQFHVACPYTVPVFPAAQRDTDMDAETWRRLWGRASADESEERYHERMAGYIGLFAAMCQTEMPHLAANPFGVTVLWTWMARVVNAKPRRITALLLVSVLEVAGYAMRLRFGQQLLKVLRLIETQVVPRLPRTAPPGPTARLVSWMRTHAQQRTEEMQPPKGRTLPPTDSKNL